MGARLALLLFALPRLASATTWYVAMTGSDTAAGTNWITANQTIQKAINASSAGDTVLVSNGVYQTGGRVVSGATTNRIAITSAISVRSVNGPSLTTIIGAKDPVSSNGDAAVRCAYVGASARLAGFTLYGGATRYSGDLNNEQSGGGVWCDAAGSVSNCIITGNSASSYGGGAMGGKFYNCTLSSNSAASGGGAYGSTLAGCHLSRNSAPSGGGTTLSFLTNCTLSANTAANSGGAAYAGVLYNCSLYANASGSGGGANGASLTSCILASNTASYFGGGAFSGALTNCLIYANTATFYGGGTYGATLVNCTVVTNSSSSGGGGTYNGTLYNSIVYFNASAGSGPNYNGSTMTACCTTPDPGGTGNTTYDPAFNNAAAADFHLKSSSPCINRASNVYIHAVADLDGRPRILNGVVDMGAYEYASTQTYCAVTLSANPTNGGAVSGGGTYSSGNSILITAAAYGGWKFINWSDGNSQNSRTIGPLTNNVTLVASFAQIQSAVAVVANPANGGTVTGGGTYPAGTNVTITAAPAANWHFTGWNDGIALTSRTITVPSNDVTYTANFAQSIATISVVANPINGGTVGGSGTYNVGAAATISASPASGWFFANWNDGDTNSSRSIIVPATNATYTANFAQVVASVTVLANPTNGGAVGGSGAYYAGSSVQIMATPNPGWLFINWNDGNTNATRSITVPVAGITCTANFSLNVAVIIVTANPATGGTVSGGGTFAVGTTQSVSAVSHSGWQFLNWSDSDTNNPKTIIVPQLGVSYAANFVFIGRTVFVQSDFDGDGKSDIAVYCPGGGTWNVLENSGSNVTYQLGYSADVAVAADYDGDGKADYALFEGPTGNWFIRLSSTGQLFSKNWGWSREIPVPADYDGDGKADLAVYDPPTGTWYILQSSNNQMRVQQWGWSQAMPVPADYDGDGRADIATYAPATGTWTILQSCDGTLRQLTWGWSQAMPVPADYDGDGKADIATYVPGAGQWLILHSSDGGFTQQNWGWSLAAPVPGDYDGDGKTDIATYVPDAGLWYILKSGGGMLQRNWGWSQALPVLPQFQINRRYFPSP